MTVLLTHLYIISQEIVYKYIPYKQMTCLISDQFGQKLLLYFYSHRRNTAQEQYQLSHT